MVGIREVVRALWRAMKGLGAVECTTYAPVNMPRIECCWDDGTCVSISAYVYKKKEVRKG